MGSERSEEKLKTRNERISGIREYQKIKNKKCGLHKHPSAFSVQDWKMQFVKHLGVSDVDFDPKNGSRMAQLAKSEI